MDPQFIRLHAKGQEFWQDVLEQYKGKLNCDLQIKGDEDEPVIRCHKLVMASVSRSIYKSLLTMPITPEDEGFIHLPDVTSATIKRLVDWVYTSMASGGKVQDTVPQSLADALEIGKKLQAPEKQFVLPMYSAVAAETVEVEGDVYYDDYYNDDEDMKDMKSFQDIKLLTPKHEKSKKKVQEETQTS